MAQKVSTKRVMVSLSPDVYSVVKRYADSLGQPTARIISVLLREIVPLLEVATQASLAARQGRLEQAADYLSKLSGDLVSEASKRRRHDE